MVTLFDPLQFSKGKKFLEPNKNLRHKNKLEKTIPDDILGK